MIFQTSSYDIFLQNQQNNFKYKLFLNQIKVTITLENYCNR